MTRARSVEGYRLRGSFEAVRKTLLEPRYADRLDKSLAFWALPNDRRLPLAFLGRSLEELLNTPFEELCATPGVGQKKIQSLIKLLYRAVKVAPPASKGGASDDDRLAAPGEIALNGHDRPSHRTTMPGFDPNAVSEALWMRWRETVERHRLEHEALGRLAPSLQDLPSVIWRTPLKFYADRTLSEIRALRTHGEKRVRVVLEVFFAVHQMLANAEAEDRLPLSVRLTPRFAADLEYWVDAVLASETCPTLDELRQGVARPLAEQVRIDAGSPVYELAIGRLGLGDEPQTVRWQSRRLGVTRARIYQLLEECGAIMAVRWPEGRAKLGALQAKVARQSDAETTAYCSRVRDLFFPEKHAPRDPESE